MHRFRAAGDVSEARGNIDGPQGPLNDDAGAVGVTAGPALDGPAGADNFVRPPRRPQHPAVVTTSKNPLLAGG